MLKLFQVTILAVLARVPFLASVFLSYCVVFFLFFFSLVYEKVSIKIQMFKIFKANTLGGIVYTSEFTVVY